MDKAQLAEDLRKAVPGLCLRIDEPMCNHTSFRIGGPADLMIWPTSIGEVQQVLKFLKCRGVPVYIMGNGSNLLVRDGGFRGVILKLAENFSRITVEGTRLQAQVGASLAKLANAACQAGLGGLEFASGIPGTLGGAIAMNAGAYGGEMADVLQEVTCCDLEGNLYHFGLEDLELGYRTSRVRSQGYIALEAVLQLVPEELAVIRAKMHELNKRRREKQPLSFPSAGSTFKRPPGHYAGKLIDDAGLRGFTHGRAQVSEQHCGFIINLGGATAKEVLELIEIVRQRVWEKFQVRLELEVQVIGED
ncbi:MAG: UDP-N-acetylmuramate dehydrogenase [Firmicutes bacterium]|nr:UDP-N-acetylmuramate dehydrogenase [Bacillota bacterium]